MIGEIIGNFRVIDRLGKGGMGEVWLGEHKEIKTKVAIKVLLPDISADKQQVQRFFNEAVAVSKIKHAGITKIFDVGFHTGGQAYLIMELLEGESLSARIKRVGRLPLRQLADVGRQIASVLEATHAEGITHRDLKPDNIFLVKDAELASGERVKVLDFGIAKLGQNTGMTGTGTMGTPSYMSPEQWKASGKVDGRADAYSLGCLAFEMACGRPPFVATSIGQACDQHLHVPPPAAKSFAPNLPASLDALLTRLLAKDPEARPSMQEVKAAFGAQAETLEQPGALDATMAPGASVEMMTPVTAPADTTLGSSAVAVALRTPAASRSKLLWLAAVGVAGVALVIVVVQRGPSDPANTTTPSSGETNRFVRIDPPGSKVLLGVSPDAPDTTRGFRPSRNVIAPTAAYEIQAHEVTWGEIERWLAEHPSDMPALPTWAKDRSARARLPATGLTWSAALAYCKSIDAMLPTEEQWEYAARGADRRPNPWGVARTDLIRTRAFAGAEATPVEVEWSDQDKTPDRALHDLAGNVQEWTLGLWRADLPDQDETWVQDAKTQTTYRAIRGLPLSGIPTPIPGRPPANDSAAFREPLCATGACPDKDKQKLPYVGFRCARNTSP